MNRSLWCAFLVLILVGLSAMAQPGRPAAPREVLVKFRTPAQAPGAIQQIARDEDLDMVRGVGGIDVLRLRSRSKDTDAMIARLRGRADVLYAEPNYVVYAIATPPDPNYPSLWGMPKISAPQAWDINTGSRSNVVAVVDTGIDYNHPDLAANVWSAPTAFTVRIGGRSITCPAGSHGFNAVWETCDPMDDNSHGTHVSGTIGAVSNGVGVVGVNWTASIMGIKFLDASGSGYTSDAVDGIEFAIQAKQQFVSGANVRVLSNSWGGGGFSQTLSAAINNANTNGMLFVAAAGNAGSNNDVTPSYPASYTADNVIAVAATDSNDALASWSNYGATSVDLAAPGVSILSTIRNGGYAYYSGTSMATPHVSGAAALVLSACSSLTTLNLKTALLNSKDPVSSLVGKTLTGGRLNVARAIQYGCGAPPTPDFTISASPSSATVRQGRTASYTVTVTPSGTFTGSVSLSVTGCPTGGTCTFNPQSTTSRSTLTVTTSNVTRATYTLTITGVSGSLTRTTTVKLTVSKNN
jgi:subtilisin family serine protease